MHESGCGTNWPEHMRRFVRSWRKLTCPNRKSDRLVKQRPVVNPRQYGQDLTPPIRYPGIRPRLVGDRMQFDQLKRREFVTLLGGAAVAWPLTARAQQPASKVWRIGLLSAVTWSMYSPFYTGFQKGMRELGYIEGKDFITEWRSAEGRYERFPELAAELVRLKVDIIVTSTMPAIRPLQQATNTIPIVMAFSTDPVGNGFVASLARPGGNTTGLAGSSDDSAPKQLELLAMVVPNASRIGFLGNPTNPTNAPVLKRASNAAQKAGLSIVPMEASDLQQINDAFAAFTNKRVQAVLVAGDPVFFGQMQRLAELALRNRLPSMFHLRDYAEAGGLMSYGEALSDFFERAATFVDKIFKGAKPGDLPIEQPTKFKLVINRKTADALGVTIPPQLYIFADEVIE
jgi:putative ABC transport system substrate-binding protein